jgi:protocatechuate 3,4-dioxygenase beta subunit
MIYQKTRRGILTGLASLFGSFVLTRNARAALPTPNAAEGPFYPTKTMRMDDTDNDLVKIVGRVREAGGEVVTLKGKLMDSDGSPHAGLRIEIWQCDINGKYLHSGDDQKVSYDKGFQGFGHDITGEDGSYSFRTIVPAKYPGRTPHIHVKILDNGRELLTTQFYLKDDPENARDNLFRSMSKSQAALVSMELHEGPDGRETTVNVVV